MRLIDREGWGRYDASISPTIRSVVIHRLAMPSYRDDFDRAAYERVEFFRREWRHTNGRIESIFFEDPERAEELIGSRGVHVDFLENELHNARVSCALALRLLRHAGELALAEEIAAGKVTEDMAARIVEGVVCRLSAEALRIPPKEASHAMRVAGIFDL